MIRFLSWLVGLAIRLCPYLSADYRRRIRAKQKCPACGAVKKHSMHFDPQQKMVVLECVECTAAWGYEPVVRTERWLKQTEA